MLTDNNIPLQQRGRRTSPVVTRIVHNTIPSTWGVNYAPSYRVTPPLEISSQNRQVETRCSSASRVRLFLILCHFDLPLSPFSSPLSLCSFCPYSFALTSRSSCPLFPYLTWTDSFHKYAQRRMLYANVKNLNSCVITFAVTFFPPSIIRTKKHGRYKWHRRVNDSFD